ncbi:MAG: hypothetical protein RL701_6587 [Pseudomonadota bacterium]
MPNHFVPSLVSIAVRRGVAPEPLFERIGRTLTAARQPDAQFSVREVELLFEGLCEDARDPSLALALGREFDAERLGLFGLVVSTSQTPRASFAALSEFKALIHPLLDLVVEETREHTHLRYAAHDGAAIGDKPHYAELLLSAVHQASVIFRAGAPARPLYAAFRHRAPSYVRAYEQTFGCELRFEQPSDELCYNVSFLDMPWRGASDSHQVFRAQAEDKLAHTESTVIRQVKRVVRTRVREPDLTLQDIARALAVSTRSLQRRLEVAGTNFRELRDGVRYERACQLLQDPATTTEATATELGYRDRSNFVRAFTRWSGQSPSQYRRSTSGAK